MKIEIGIPTKDRYENLALLLWSICEQTHQDFVVTIVDDSENRKDIRELPYMLPILKRLDQEGHAWRVEFGDKKGSHYSLQMILNKSRCPYVFILDDDTVIDTKCLEYLVQAWKDGVGAVGPIVMNPSIPVEFRYLPKSYKSFKKFRGFIDEYGRCDGDHHWKLHPDDELQETDHLQCFLVDLDAAKEIGGFDLNYNVTGFRSETDFCYCLFKKGYKLYVQPKALVWHFQSPLGGIRSINPPKYLYDECHEYYIDKYSFKRGRNQNKVIKIFGGLGDHLCATPLLRSLKKKGKVVVSAVYPYIFAGNPNVDELIFVSEEKDYKEVDSRNIYDWAGKNGFTGKLSEAWCRTYGERYDGDKLDYVISPQEKEWVLQNVETAIPFILIAPYSAIPAIQYPEIDQTSSSKKMTVIRDWFKDRWEELVKEIQKLGIQVFQVGGVGEELVGGCNAYYLGIDYRLTMALLERSIGFISVDSFLQHAGHAVGKKGVVLFGPSDPSITGHESNINLKSSKCDQDLICMKQTFPVSQWTFKSSDCKSRMCMKAITVDMVLNGLLVVRASVLPLPSLAHLLTKKGK